MFVAKQTIRTQPCIRYSWISIYNNHYNDVIIGAIASQITSLASVCSAVTWGAYQRKHQSSASLAFVRGIHRRPVNSPHKGPVAQKMFPFDAVIMFQCNPILYLSQRRGIEYESHIKLINTDRHKFILRVVNVGRVMQEKSPGGTFSAVVYWDYKI